MKKLETKSMVLLKHHLKALKMPTMHDECEKIAVRCAKENVDHLGFLLQLCEQELIDRERRAAQRRLKAAKFPNYKTLEDFKFQAQPTINRVLVSELMRGEYIEKRESVILIGHPGTGKTHIATALGIAACGQGKKVRFHRVTELITQLMVSAAVSARTRIAAGTDHPQRPASPDSREGQRGVSPHANREKLTGSEEMNWSVQPVGMVPSCRWNRGWLIAAKLAQF